MDRRSYHGFCSQRFLLHIVFCHYCCSLLPGVLLAVELLWFVVFADVGPYVIYVLDDLYLYNRMMMRNQYDLYFVA